MTDLTFTRSGEFDVDLIWHRRRSGDFVSPSGFKIERLAARRYRLHGFDRHGVRYISDHNCLAFAKVKAEMMWAREQAGLSIEQESAL